MTPVGSAIFTHTTLRLLLLKQFGQQQVQAGKFVIVNLDRQQTVAAQQRAQQAETRPHKVQPARVPQTVGGVGQAAGGGVGRVDVDAFDGLGKLGQQRPQDRQVVAEDQPVLVRFVLETRLGRGV